MPAEGEPIVLVEPATMPARQTPGHLTRVRGRLVALELDRRPGQPRYFRTGEHVLVVRSGAGGRSVSAARFIGEREAGEWFHLQGDWRPLDDAPAGDGVDV